MGAVIENPESAPRELGETNIGFPESVPIGLLDGFDCSELELTKEWLNSDKHIRYCYFKTRMSREEKCPHCGSRLFRFGRRRHSYRDLPRLADRTVLVIDMQRFRCKEEHNETNGNSKQRSFVQRIEGIDSRRSMTTRCLDWIRSNCLLFPFQQIADLIGCDFRTVRDIAYERIDKLNQEYRRYIPIWMGIDETFFNGNRNEGRCVLVDLELKKPIDLLKSRKKEDLLDWFKTVGKNDSPHLLGVAMDMCDYFRDTIREAFPYAQIVLDRFHIERYANKAVDRVRINTGKRLKKKLGKNWNAEEWNQNSHLLRKHSYQIPNKKTLPKKKNDLLIKQLKIPNYTGNYHFFEWMALQPEIKMVYELKEKFCEIYTLSRRYEAKQHLEQWATSVPDHLRGPFGTLLRTTSDWKNEFLAYFPSEKTNGYTEAFNSVAKRINRTGNGYSFEVLRARLLFGKKPKYKVVKLKPPEPEAFLLDSEPRSETCLQCGQSSDTDNEILKTYIDAGKTPPRPWPDDEKDDDGFPIIRCPLCRRRVNLRILDHHFQTHVLDKIWDQDRKQHKEDLSVGDYESAARFAGNLCHLCGELFDADQLRPYGFQFLGRQHIQTCTTCDVGIHASRETQDVADESDEVSGTGEPIAITDSDKPVASDFSTAPIANCQEPPNVHPSATDQQPSQVGEVCNLATKHAPRHRTLARDLAHSFPKSPRSRKNRQLSFAFTDKANTTEGKTAATTTQNGQHIPIVTP
jgi:transposase